MPNTKTITKTEQYKLSSGELTVKIVPGNAHLTTTLIYYNNILVANGEGIVEFKVNAKSGDKFFIISTINKPEGSSDFASLSIVSSDDENSIRWDYSSKEPDYDEVIYEVFIKLT